MVNFGTCISVLIYKAEFVNVCVFVMPQGSGH